MSIKRNPSREKLKLEMGALEEVCDHLIPKRILSRFDGSRAKSAGLPPDWREHVMCAQCAIDFAVAKIEAGRVLGLQDAVSLLLARAESSSDDGG